MSVNIIAMNVVAVAGAFLQLILGLIFAAVAIFLGVRLFDKLTKGIDEMEELKRGNVAVGILLAAVVITIAEIVGGGVSGLSASAVSGNLSAIAGGILQLLLSLILAVVAIFLALNIFSKVTKGIDEQAELRSGNVAVAVLLSGFLIAVGLVITSGVAAIGAAFNS